MKPGGGIAYAEFSRLFIPAVVPVEPRGFDERAPPVVAPRTQGSAAQEAVRAADLERKP